MSNKQNPRLSVDIGGTFTDVVLMSSDGEILSSAKTPTTHSNPSDGAMVGVLRVFEQSGVAIDQVGLFVHGTTLATNALIERRGADVACVTTEGFRDILEIGYERRYDQYDVMIDKPDLLVPRSRCFTVPERMSWQGQVLLPLNTGAIDELVEKIERSGVQALAIGLLHSYANDAHEVRLGELLQQRLPKLSISLSSEVSPEAREFDRLCTTIANAYIQPLMASYLDSLARQLAAAGLTSPILMITASGGMTTLDTAARLPIRLVESGPAGGAVLAAQIAEQCHADSVLSFDMGGTTAKLCLIDHYRPQQARHFEIARASRFIKGSGMPVRIPVIEMIEIGAGGGSIAGIDSLGRLKVGPQSAGSEPGPAAYGKGGQHATVTDADMAMGYLDAEHFAEGLLQLNATANEEALSAEVAQPLNVNVMQAAVGISEIVNENMANAARMHAVESGKDLGNRLMIAFGGNGPLHATRIARRAGIKRILIPPNPGVGSAVGFLFAPVSFEIVKSYYTLLEEIELSKLNTFLDGLITEATAIVKYAVPEDPLQHRRVAFMRYQGQGHEIEIELPDHVLEGNDISELRDRFEAEYRHQYSRPVPGMKIEILNWGVSVSNKPERLSAEHKNKCSTDVKLLTDALTREITCDYTGDTVIARIYERSQLITGQTIDGPALIVEPQTTTMVSADFTAEVDTQKNILLSRRPAP